MWVNIDVIPGGEEVIYLPSKLTRRLNEIIIVSLGKKMQAAVVLPGRDLKSTGGDSYENPQTIRVSKRLAERLCLPDTITYQIKYNNSRMVIGPAIGLLLGGHNYSYSPLHMKKYSDRFGIYHKIGGLIYAFSYRTINWREKTVYGLYFNNKKSVWQYGKFPLPTAIYRRDFHTDPKIEKRLSEAVKGRMFNSWRFTKFYLYKYVRKDSELISYLPETELTKDFEQIKAFIDRQSNIILKPTHLSRGRGICIINKMEDSYRVFDYRNKVVKEVTLAGEDELKEFFTGNKEFFDKYLIQQHLKLAKINGSPFDIRVVMQKEATSNWKCSGIECRVAGEKTLVTNISRGGYAVTLDKALEMAFPDANIDKESIKQHVNELCFKLCTCLEKTGGHFAEFGMDIAIDEYGKLWIIEVNVFPSFKGFKTMDKDIYKEIRETPILYAAHLAGFGSNRK